VLINRNPLVLVGRKTLEPGTLRDLMTLMKQKRLKAAIPGYGTTGHLAITGAKAFTVSNGRSL
jgi:tripartite-type tricarboxylate transporter receptor subunit TctC